MVRLIEIHQVAEVDLARLYRLVKSGEQGDGESLDVLLRETQARVRALEVPRSYLEAHLCEAEALIHHQRMLKALNEGPSSLPSALESYKKGKGLRLRALKSYQ